MPIVFSRLLQSQSRISRRLVLPYTTSSPRKENSGRGFSSIISRRRANERSMTRSRAGCPGLYRDIVLSVCANDMRNFETSILIRDGFELSGDTLRAERLLELGVTALDREVEDLLDGRILRPVRRERGESGEHLRSLRQQLPFAQEPRLLRDLRDEPVHRLLARRGSRGRRGVGGHRAHHLRRPALAAEHRPHAAV